MVHHPQSISGARPVIFTQNVEQFGLGVGKSHHLGEADSIPVNLKVCKKGTWKERLFVETALSMVACVSAMLNILLALFHDLHPDAPPMQLTIAEFSL